MIQKEIGKKLKEQLEHCKWESFNEDYFEIELPVVLYFNYQRLRLYIYPTEDGYYITDDGHTFEEYSYNAKCYLELFEEKDLNNHYKIHLEKEFITKKYDYDYSLMSALDEFVRYFIYLDEFMNKFNMT